MNESGKRLREWLEIWRQADYVYVRFLKRWNLSMNEYFVLRLLHESPQGREPARLAEAAGIRRQLVASILREFESRGLILRQDHPTDLRRRVIVLTETGRDFAGRVIREIDDLDLKGFSGLSQEEQEKLIEYSRRFFEALRKASPGRSENGPAEND